MTYNHTQVKGQGYGKYQVSNPELFKTPNSSLYTLAGTVTFLSHSNTVNCGNWPCVNIYIVHVSNK